MSTLVRLCLLALFVALLPTATAQAAASSNSGVFIEVKSSEAAGASTERYKLYGASHALVIGIDNYTNGWPRLSNAVKDARLVVVGQFEILSANDVIPGSLPPWPVLIPSVIG